MHFETLEHAPVFAQCTCPCIRVRLAPILYPYSVTNLHFYLHFSRIPPAPVLAPELSLVPTLLISPLLRFGLGAITRRLHYFFSLDFFFVLLIFQIKSFQFFTAMRLNSKIFNLDFREYHLSLRLIPFLFSHHFSLIAFPPLS